MKFKKMIKNIYKKFHVREQSSTESSCSFINLDKVPGSPGPRGSPELVRRAIDLNYEARQRAVSLRWSIINAIILLVFAYDLTRWCAGGSVALYAEACAAGAALAGAARHAARLLRPALRTHPHPIPITATQRRLLALHNTPLDGSFRLVEEEAEEKRWGSEEGEPGEVEGVCGVRARRGPAPAPASPPRSPPHSPPSPTPQDRFIADSASLAQYLKQQSERWAEWAGPGPAAVALSVGVGGGGAPRYVVAAPPEPDPAAPPSPPAPRLFWRLDLDPERLTQFNLNLRLWIHMTILERLVREMEVADLALWRHGHPALGEASVDRLRALAPPPTPAHHPLHCLHALIPFLEPFQDQRYVVGRIRELARGGCLSEYRWCGGGAGWGPGKPTDAEVVLALVAAYLDAQLPPPPARPFSSLHLALAPPPPGAPPPPPGALKIVRVGLHPPHYALALDGELLEVGGGRNNLVHTLLVFLAAAARHAPPGSALQRHNLGPAGLNMLWVIAR